MRKFTSKTIRKIAISILLVTALLSAIVYVSYTSYNNHLNYAEVEARPIEQSLIENGAMKRCSSGDPGKGPDNIEPWYDATYTMPKDRLEADKIINQVARDHGYDLVNANPENRGHLGAVADPYIKDWYFDNTSKQSYYQGFDNGSIELALSLNANGSDKVCSDEPLKKDGNNSIITLRIGLPRATDTNK